MVMGPLMEYSQKYPDLRPQDAMSRMVMETDRAMRFQMAQQNGPMPMNAGQRTPGPEWSEPVFVTWHASAWTTTTRLAARWRFSSHP